ncbi:DUF1048 domain-containing protein [Enterococcus asini]|uniref:DUF1048 domain-containing protein n=1 Tax=Enterococcus asini TaxID=57732 RepID=UPI00288E562F|nr:DUF1048 domain-containing protein [Enterococcus asini]MDT2757520.1 DUF1048 domain-containing protein [Enterococcus asini]
MIKREYWDLKYLKQTKEKYKEELQRVEKLPADYQSVFHEVSEYLTATYGGFDGLDLMEVQYQLIDLLEEASAQGITAEAFVGADVTEFAKDFGKAVELPNWMDHYLDKRQQKINKRIQRKLGGQ